MTVYGTEEIDINPDDSTEIRPSNADAIGFKDPDAARRMTAPAPSDEPSTYYAPPRSLADDDDTSLFGELAAEAEREISDEVFFPVEHRPGWVLGFRANVDQKELKRYRNAATQNGKRKESDPDLVIGSVMPIVEKNIGVYRVKADGARQKMIDPTTGRDLKVDSPKFVDLFAKGKTEIDALKKFLGGDAEVSKLGDAILRASGWGGEDYSPLDPTDG